MNKQIKGLIKQAQTIKLSVQEKSDLKIRLIKRMETSDVRNSLADRRILQRSNVLHLVITNLNSLVLGRNPMIATLIIALLATGSVAVAAEQSLPGDAFYTVKTGVNEEVRDWFELSHQAQANWDTRKAERRLEEAERLAVIGKLDNQFKTEIRAKFDKHVDAVKARQDKIDTQKMVKLENSLELNSRLEAMLKAHQEILNDLLTANKELETKIEPILERIDTKLEKIEERKADIESKVTVDVSAKLEAAANGKMKAAENKIAEVEKFINAKGDDVRAEIRTRAEAKLNSAKDVSTQGKASLEANNFNQAFVQFSQSMHLAQQAKIMIAASHKLEIKKDRLDLKLQNNAKVESKTDKDGNEVKANLQSNVETKNDIDRDDDNDEDKGSSSKTEAKIDSSANTDDDDSGVRVEGNAGVKAQLEL